MKFLCKSLMLALAIIQTAHTHTASVYYVNLSGYDAFYADDTLDEVDAVKLAQKGISISEVELSEGNITDVNYITKSLDQHKQPALRSDQIILPPGRNQYCVVLILPERTVTLIEK